VEEAVEVRRRVADDDPATLPDLADSLDLRAGLLLEAGRVTDAILTSSAAALAIRHHEGRRHLSIGP
jgi:hypothetical protein